jgi:hypothetical protein
VELVEGMLFVELVKDGGGWLWCNDRVDNKLKLVLGYWLGGFMLERGKSRKGSIGGEVVPIAWCGLPL